MNRIKCPIHDIYYNPAEEPGCFICMNNQSWLSQGGFSRERSIWDTGAFGLDLNKYHEAFIREKQMKLTHCNKLKQAVEAIEEEAKQTARESIDITNEEILNCILELADTLKTMDKEVREEAWKEKRKILSMLAEMNLGVSGSNKNLRDRIYELECNVDSKLATKKDKWFK